MVQESLSPLNRIFEVNVLIFEKAALGPMRILTGFKDFCNIYHYRVQMDWTSGMQKRFTAGSPKLNTKGRSKKTGVIE